MYLLCCMTHLAIQDMAKLFPKALVQFYILLGSKMRITLSPHPCYCVRSFVSISVVGVLGVRYKKGASLKPRSWRFILTFSFKGFNSFSCYI